MAPPCSTWSRAVWSNREGPQPVRSAEFPYGFPWLSGAQKQKADAGTRLVQRSMDAASAAHKANVAFLIEHPEYLGACNRGNPASIWMLPEMRTLAQETKAATVVFHQCQFESVKVAKPTRLLSTVHQLDLLGFCGWPRLSKSQQYLGPLPRACQHGTHVPLIGMAADGEFRTAASAAWPPSMCEAIALLMLRHLQSQILRSPHEGGGNLRTRPPQLLGKNLHTRSPQFLGKPTDWRFPARKNMARCIPPWICQRAWPYPMSLRVNRMRRPPHL